MAILSDSANPDCQCDSCLGKIPPSKPVRYCYICQRLMGRMDKWVFDLVVIEKRPRRVASIIRHRHCDNPEGYMLREHYQLQTGREHP
jgi:hypothetical protein